jgi:hemerythrin-like domain-containing protein
MKPTRILELEHRVIEQVLDCLDRIANRCQADGRLDAESARNAVDFFRTFADRCHHGKEEQQLFPMMEARGFPADSGPVAVMRVEHDHGRALVQGMEVEIEFAADGKPESCARYVNNARSFSALLREHIRKEDHCLFPMADGALGEDDQLELAKSFERAEQEDMTPGERERCLRLADDLADRWGVASYPLSEVRGTAVPH